MSVDVSVIIPLFNSKKEIDNILMNLREQTLSNDRFEVIFIDDGSTDGTFEYLLDKIKYDNNLFLYHQSNKKQAEARNNGIRNAKGKYVVFIDSDDKFDGNYLESLLNLSGNNDVVYSGICKIFPNNKKIIETPVFEDNDKMLEDFLVKGKECENGVWSKLYKRDFLLKNNILFENKNFFEDSLFNFQVLLKSSSMKIVSSKYVGYYLIKHENTTTNEFHPEIYDLAIGYMNKVKDMLGTNELTRINLDLFESREFIHIIHHFIRFSSYRKSRIIINRLKFRLVFNKSLPWKYRGAIFLLKSLFPIYYLLYKMRDFILFEKG
ncbi:glycosyltransferase family 2 protein [Apilactobacillus kunkeei]|nr:glycosyltransferase family 2 protein [Apilactobacillus kunkeei]TMT04238.1 glycosyltransferase family 2 protein [Apilactobacillus kunkeei]